MLAGIVLGLPSSCPSANGAMAPDVFSRGQYCSVQGDIKKVRVAVCAGIAVPLVMFILWDAAILGNLGNPHLQARLHSSSRLQSTTYWQILLA